MIICALIRNSLMSFVFLTALANESAVTFKLSGGRFGDNLIAYLHAKWVSYKFDIPVLFQEFKYSNQLAMHYREKTISTDGVNNYNKNEIEKFKRVIYFQRDNMPTSSQENTLYIIPFFSESLEEYKQKGINWPYFKVNWKDATFLKIIKELICPVKKLALLPIPKDKVSIAIHIRTGEGFDENLEKTHPLKSPPLQFYIDSLQKILNILKDQPLYVFIFTDDPNPQKFTKLIREQVVSEKIEWAYRTNNFHDSNVLEDFFSLIRFDGIIRSESNFPLCASKLTDYAIEISPAYCHISKKIKQNALNNHISEMQ